MKKFVAGCLVSLVILVLVVIGVVAWAFKAGAKEQEKFFAAVYSGDPQQVLALFDPSLVEEVDEPVIAEWMNAMKETLGEPEGLKASSFNTNKKYEDGVVVTESSGKIRFEKGEAESKLVLHNGKIVEFNVTSDKLGQWFTQLPSTQLYEEKGRQCLELTMAGKVDEARALMHEALQKELPPETLREFAQSNQSEAGTVQSVTCQSREFSPDETPCLTLIYAIQCEKKALTGKIEFTFPGLKGCLTALNISPAE